MPLQLERIIYMKEVLAVLQVKGKSWNSEETKTLAEGTQAKWCEIFIVGEGRLLTIKKKKHSAFHT